MNLQQEVQLKPHTMELLTTQQHLEESLVVQVEEAQLQLHLECVTLQSVPIPVDQSETHLPTVES